MHLLRTVVWLALACLVLVGLAALEHGPDDSVPTTHDVHTRTVAP